MAHANPVQIQKYLKGVDYPASREQLIDNAKKLGADDNIRASLEQLPDENFRTPAEVSQAVAVASGDDGEANAQASEAGQFLIRVMEDSLAEMELCMIALDNAGTDEVKDFAQTMLNEHGKLGRQIEALAQRMGVRFPKKVPAGHTRLINQMAGLKGDAFDRKFIDENMRYHQNDLKVFEHYAAQRHGGELGKLADDGLRLFEKHLKMVNALAQQRQR